MSVYQYENKYYVFNMLWIKQKLLGCNYQISEEVYWGINFNLDSHT